MELPDHFDLVVVGTGLVESAVAAAGARLGHSVLHIDTNDCYGGDWASYTWDGLQKWIQNLQTETEKDKSSDLKEILNEGEEFVSLGENKTVTDLTENWYTSENAKDDNNDKDIDGETSSEPQKWTKSRIEEQSRRFNIDLAPRLLFSRGSMVELLISSNISRYTEFKSVSRVLTLLNGQLEHVPSSRADVFGTKHVSVVEKRILMKFLTFCLHYESDPSVYENYVNRTYIDFLKHQKLTDNLIHFVVHAIAMVTPDSNCLKGLEATKKFLSSLGRFGNTPFLWSMYGSGELPQAFCRLCAVFGGTYYLGRSVDGIIVKGDKCVGLVTEGQRIGCDNLVLADSRMSSRLEPQLSRSTVSTSRGIYIATSSVLPAEKEQLTFLSIPPTEERPHPIMAVEVSAGAAACPRDLHLLHASCKTMTSPASDLSPVISTLHPVPQETLAYSLTFSQTTRTSSDPSTALANVFCASGPTPQLDFDYSISEAKEIYRRIYPEEEFLPRAPDPEEIIIGEQGDKAGETEGKETIEEEAEKSAETGGKETVGEQNEKSGETEGKENKEEIQDSQPKSDDNMEVATDSGDQI